MTQDRPPRLERFLEQAARRFSGPLHPIEILQRVRAEADSAATDGRAANMIRVVFHPADYRRYQRALPRLREEIAAMLDDQERTGGLRRDEERIISFETSDAVAEGMPEMTARFADTRHRDAAPPPGATRRLTRHRDAVLVFPDGGRTPITHTPFTIGRGPGNDLVLPSLAVSRRHAELTRTDEGFVVRDLGSRNGVTIRGGRHDLAVLAPGDVMVLGDIALRLELLA
jgi:hypothetical protein